MKSLQLDVVATRGADIESRHRVHAAVVGPDDTLSPRAHSPDVVSSWRSCAKPFQVMPLLESGGFDELRWGDDQLALACASHGGEPEHVAIAQAMLHDIGLEEGDLACGPHDPLSSRGMKLLRESGARLTRAAQQLLRQARRHARARADVGLAHVRLRAPRPSGAALLPAGGRRVDRTWPRTTSVRPSTAAASWRSRCRSRTWRARWSRLARAVRDDDAIPTRIVNAMRTRPFLVGGTDRFDSVLIEETDGRVVAKIGAEGVHSVGVPELGLGFAVKVDDGAQRAQFPAVLRVLQVFDVLPGRRCRRASTSSCARPVRNTRGETVGEVALRRLIDAFVRSSLAIVR